MLKLLYILPFSNFVENDEFNSNSVAGVLGYQLPSVMDLFGRAWEDFNGKILPNGWNPDFTFILSMLNTDDGLNLSCSSTNNCKIKYSRDYTPILLDVTPANVY